MKDAGIELCDISKSYGTQPAVIGVSMSIAAGTHTAILGPSGSGKSTILRLLAGLETPSVGSITIDGRIVSQANRSLVPPHERRLSLVFQDLALWPNLTVEENVRLGLAGQRVSRDVCRARAKDALAVCSIGLLAGRKPSEISGGEQQRTALARAIAVQPRYLLLDEPFSGVDPATKQSLLSEIASLAAHRSVTVLLVTHDPAEAVALCRNTYVLDHGHIREFGATTELIHRSEARIFVAFRQSIQLIAQH